MLDIIRDVTSSSQHAGVCAAGIVVSVYSLYVEMRKSRDTKYVAACDFNDNMSCSRVLTSEYSKGFGLLRYLVGKDSYLNVPNCVMGIVFYTAQMTAGMLSYPWALGFLLYSSLASVILSLYLAYILFAVLKDVCVVCVTTYVINGVLLYHNYRSWAAG